MKLTTYLKYVIKIGAFGLVQLTGNAFAETQLLVGQAVIPPTASSVTVTFSTPPDSAIPPADAVIFESTPIVVGSSDGRQQSLGLLLPDDAADIRISNITTTGFTASYQRKRNTLFGTVTEVTAPTVPITFHYIAVTPGRSELPGGMVVEAGKLTNQAFNNPANITFESPYNTIPAVFTGFQSFNNPTDWLVANTLNVATQSASFVMTNRSASAAANSEDIGYIAFSSGATKFVASDGLATGIQALPNQAGISGPTGSYPTDCNEVQLDTDYLTVVGDASSVTSPVTIGNQATANQAGGTVRRCTSSSNDKASFYIDSEAISGNRTTVNELTSVLALNRPFYASFGLVADYQLDQCRINLANASILDSGPYTLNGVGNGLTRETVTGLPAPAPLCGAAGLSLNPSSPSGVAVSDDPLFDIQGTISMAAWFNFSGTQTETGFPELQTLAGKGTDSFRLAIEKVCTIDSGGTRVIDEASTRGTGINLCDVAGGTGLASSEIHHVIRFEVTNQASGLATFIRSTQIGTNQANLFFDPRGVVTAGSWQHVRATFDGFSFKLTVDDNPIAETLGTSAIPLNTNNEPFSLGLSYSGTTTSALYDGLLDEVTLWENALSMERLNTLHRQRTRLCQSCGREIIYWREVYKR